MNIETSSESFDTRRNSAKIIHRKKTCSFFLLEILNVERILLRSKNHTHAKICISLYVTNYLFLQNQVVIKILTHCFLWFIVEIVSARIRIYLPKIQRFWKRISLRIGQIKLNKATSVERAPTHLVPVQSVGRA